MDLINITLNKRGQSEKIVFCDPIHIKLKNRQNESLKFWKGLVNGRGQTEPFWEAGNVPFLHLCPGYYPIPVLSITWVLFKFIARHLMICVFLLVCYS